MRCLASQFAHKRRRLTQGMDGFLDFGCKKTIAPAIGGI
jgi:hypothetical protein